MFRAHRIRLTPNRQQASAFERHAGFARLAYNWSVSEFSAGLSVGDWCGDRTLRPRFNTIKRILWPWCDELSANASKGAIIDAGRAISRWGQYRKDGGRFVGFPRYKRRGSRKSFHADNGPGTITAAGRLLQLPGKMGGAIRMRELVRWDGVIKTCVISKRAGHWYASLAIDDGLPLPAVADNGRPVIGVDLGVKELAVCSDDVRYDAPKPLRRLAARLRRLNKALSRKVRGSANWHKQVAAIQRLHTRIANLRTDAIHKATSAIVSRAGEVRCEDLHIAGMMRNRRLARAIADTGMAEFLRQLEYKCAWAGVAFSKVSRWYPSSRLCNHCGWRNDTLTLSQREWWCGGCGVRLDRDANAAANIRDYCWPGAAGLQPVEICVSPAAPAAVVEAGIETLNRQLRLC